MPAHATRDTAGTMGRKPHDTDKAGSVTRSDDESGKQDCTGSNSGCGNACKGCARIRF
ncbi:MAG: hypothetical protein VX874_24175 [Pseudomonadota bacterium]|nr:hypothetical protein [Pseudomonadota bacterium]